MNRRVLKWGLEAVAILVAGLAVLLLLAAGRLAMGPVSLGFAIPQIERSLSFEEAGLAVTLGTATLRWDSRDRSVEIVGMDVRVVDQGGAEQAHFPEVAASFSLRVLLSGRLAPSALEIHGASMAVIRDEAGQFGLGEPPDRRIPDEDVTAPPGPMVKEAPEIRGAFAERVFAAMADPADPASPLAWLESLSITGAEILFDDRKGATRWRAVDADLLLIRDREGLGASGQLTMVAGDMAARLELAGAYLRDEESIRLETRFQDLSIRRILDLVPGTESADGLELPLSGRLDLHFGLEGGFGPIELVLDLGPGRIDFPDLLAAPLAVDGGRFRLAAASGLESWTLETLELVSEGVVLALSGTLDREGDTRVANAMVNTGTLEVADLLRFWPLTVAPGGREWVDENLTEGRIDAVEVAIGLDMGIGPDMLERIDLRSLEGGFAFQDATLHYLRPLPPLSGVSGRGRIDAESLLFTVTSGGLGGLAVDEGTIRIDGFDDAVEMLAVEAVARGPVDEAVALLASPRLDLLKGFGFGVDAVGGVMATRLAVAFPLLADLDFDSISIRAASSLRGASLSDAALGQDMTDGALTLQIDKEGMDVEGTLRLAEVPLALRWTENFYDGAAFSSRFEVTGRVDTAGRARLGFDALPYLDGPVDLDLVYTVLPDQRASLSGTAAITDAVARIEEIDWEKPTGADGFIRFTADLVEERLRRIGSLSVRAGDLVAEGSLDLAEDGKTPSAFRFDRLSFGETDIVVRGAGDQDGSLRLAISGEAVDLRPFLEGGSDQEELRPLAIAINVAQVRVGDGSPLRAVSGSLARDHRDWKAIDLQARVGEQGEMTLRLEREGDGRRLRIAADDAGAALESLAILRDMQGGTLLLTGRYHDTVPDAPLIGTVDIRNFRMLRQPVFAKLLSVASLPGILDALRGQGIAFNQAEIPFTMTGDRIEIGESRAFGAAVGVTARGWVDLERNELDLSGTLVPAYTLNTVFGHIPLLGPLLTGERGSGLFAATYRMRGPMADPDISINPLAALAPGFLRNLFNLFDTPDTEPTVEPPGPAPDAAPAD